MHNIYKLKDMLMEELKEYGQKGELTPGSLDVIDKLAHATKNVCRIIDDCDGEYSSRGYRYDDSFARNRRRDTMGRYSKTDGGMNSLLAEMRDMMPSLPEDKRREVQRFVDKMYGM